MNLACIRIFHFWDTKSFAIYLGPPTPNPTFALIAKLHRLYVPKSDHIGLAMINNPLPAATNLKLELIHRRFDLCICPTGSLSVERYITPVSFIIKSVQLRNTCKCVDQLTTYVTPCCTIVR